MNRRKVGLALIVVVLLGVIALVWRRRSGGDDDDGGSSNKSVASEGRGARGARARARVDVATVERGSISGTVREPGGKGVGGAAVCGLVYSRELPEEETRDPLCTTSAADGTYTLAKLLPGSYQVHAQAPSYIPGRHGKDDDDWGGFKLAAGEARRKVDIVLRPGGVLVKGVVVDIGGGGVEGAWVFARAGQRWDARGGMGSAKSGAGGAFEVWMAPGPAHFTAQAEGYAEGDKEAIAPGQTVEILLTPESVLAGRVIEKKGGAPVPGATVSVGGWNGFGDGEQGSFQSATTDEEGRFRLTRLSPARYKPAADAPGRHGVAAESVLLGLGQTVEDVVIEVHPASVLTGRVVLADGKTPCERGWVALENKGTHKQNHHGIEEDGTVEIDAVLAGTYKVTVDCQGQVAPEEIPDLVVAEGVDPPEQVWKVGAGARVRGVVLTHDGRPVADAEVSLRPGGGERGWMDFERERTGDDGRFEIGGVRAGRYKASAQAPKEASLEEPIEVEVPEGGETNVEIRLVRGGGVAGQVVDERGQPVARVTVRASGGKRWSWGENDSSQTIDDGSFAIDGLRPGSYRVTASRERWWGGELRAPGKGDDEQQGEVALVRPGETARVRLVVESQGGAIRGRVVDGAGAPVTDAFVDAQRESESAAAAEGEAAMSMRWGWSRTPTLTDTDGKFTIDKLSPGRYTVRAYRKGGGETLAEKVPVGGSVTLTVRQTGSIAGTVKTKDGPPPEILSVSVSDAKTGFHRREEFFRSGGAFTMRDLPAGAFEVSATATEGNGLAKAQLAEGQALTGLSIDLGARAGVKGRLVTADTDKPLAGFMVQVMPTGRPTRDMQMMFGDGTMPPMSKADGTFEVPDAPAGRVQIMAFPVNMEGTLYAFARKVAVLEPGRTTDIGTIKVQKMRARPDEKPGDLGYELKQPGMETDIEKMDLIVAVVRPDGPAAKAGLVVGDQIVSVDGEDVRTDPFQYWMLSHVTAGTTLTLGLERGETVKIKAGPPRE